MKNLILAAVVCVMPSLSSAAVDPETEVKRTTVVDSGIKRDELHQIEDFCSITSVGRMYVSNRDEHDIFAKESWRWQYICIE